MSTLRRPHSVDLSANLTIIPQSTKYIFNASLFSALHFGIFTFFCTALSFNLPQSSANVVKPPWRSLLKNITQIQKIPTASTPSADFACALTVYLSASTDVFESNCSNWDNFSKNTSKLPKSCSHADFHNIH